MACLDTSVLLDFTSRRDTRARSAITSLLTEIAEAGEALCTTRFNIAELYVGIKRSVDPDSEARRVGAALEGLPVLDFDDAAAARFGWLKAALLNRGRPIADMDILIGATAHRHGESIITRNPRDFERMAGLVVRSY